MAEKRFEDMTFDDIIESKYFKGTDTDERGMLLTIKNWVYENMALEDKLPEFKWVVFFRESDKGLVIGPVNRDLIKAALGIDKPAQSIGKKIVVYLDPTVQMKGKVVGGLRVRAPRLSAPLPDDVPAPVADRAQVAEDYRRGTGRAEAPLEDDFPF